MIPREGPLGEVQEQPAGAAELGKQAAASIEETPESARANAARGVEAEASKLVLPEIGDAQADTRQQASIKSSAGSHTRRPSESVPTKRLGAHAPVDATGENAPAEKPQAAPSAKKSEKEIMLGGRTVNYGMIFKFVGLLVFFGLMALICYLIWPTISGIFEEGGADRLVEDMRNAGPMGVLMLLGLQFLQIVVAFIPGEVVQVAAGMMYGPWLGALIIIVGCVGSSAFIYWLVHKLGAPFVQAMVPERFIDRLDDFETSGKLNVVVFILFLIPGLPKDTFTYIVPLTRMRMGTFLILANVARIPGIVASTYVAHGLSEGQMVGPIIIVAIVAVAAVIAVLFRDKIMDALGRGKDE